MRVDHLVDDFLAKWSACVTQNDKLPQIVVPSRPPGRRLPREVVDLCHAE